MAHRIDLRRTSTTSGVTERRRSAFLRFRDAIGVGCWQVIAMYEFVRLARSEADAELAAELGLAQPRAGDAAERTPEASQLLAGMASRVGVDCGAIKDRRIVREMLRICASCTVHARCRASLQSDQPLDDRVFCPNAEIFEAIRFGALPTGHPYGAPRLLSRAISRTTGLSQDDADGAIRDYRCARDGVLDHSLMQSGSSDAVRSRGGPLAVIRATLDARHSAEGIVG